MNLELVRARAAGLVRRGWRPTLVLAVLAGVAGGLAMAVVAAGRRTATAYDRFEAFADRPELLINFCPPDMTPGDVDAIRRCYTYDAVEERRVLAGLAEVEAAARGEFRGVTLAPADDPADTTAASTVALLDPGPPSPAGRYLLVDGRDAHAADEVVVNEALARRSGLAVGDRTVLTFWSKEELGAYGEDGDTFDGPSVEAEVVGVARGLTDLAVSQAGSGADAAAAAAIPRAMARATPDAGGFTGVLVQAVEDEAEAVEVALAEALPNRIYNAAPAIGDDEIEPTREAISYEARATTVVGLVVGLLAATFVGQAVARQSRREWSDGPTLRAVGVTTGTAGASALVRGLAIGVPAAILATVVAITLSPRGPVGVGRRAEIDPGVRVNGLVLAVGALLVLVVCATAAAVPLFGGRALRAVRPAPPRQEPRRGFALPPVPSAGLQLARSGRGAGVELVVALVSAATAVLTIVAGATLIASFDDLTSTPARFGAPWDVSVGAGLDGGPAAVSRGLRAAGLEDEVDRAAVITGSDLRVGGEVAWVHAYLPFEDEEGEPIGGPLDLPIDRGRPPANVREIVLGTLTMAAADLSLGDTVTVENLATGDRVEVEVVGTTMVNDTFEASPGRGGAATPELLERIAPEVMGEGDPVVFGLEHGADTQAFMHQIRQHVDTPVDGPVQQAAVRNVGRIRYLPYVMTAVVTLLAVASLVHALVLSVGRHRRVLGLLKGLGFTRRQVGSAVAWHASSYAVLALVVALPLGVASGRWGWRLIAEALGVPPVSVVPFVAPALGAVAFLALANLAAVYPAWRAARLSTAAALRTE